MDWRGVEWKGREGKGKKGRGGKKKESKGWGVSEERTGRNYISTISLVLSHIFYFINKTQLLLRIETMFYNSNSVNFSRCHNFLKVAYLY